MRVENTYLIDGDQRADLSEDEAALLRKFGHTVARSAENRFANSPDARYLAVQEWDHTGPYALTFQIRGHGDESEVLVLRDTFVEELVEYLSLWLAEIREPVSEDPWD